MPHSSSAPALRLVKPSLSKHRTRTIYKTCNSSLATSPNVLSNCPTPCSEEPLGNMIQRLAIFSPRQVPLVRVFVEHLLKSVNQGTSGLYALAVCTMLW